MNLEEKFEEYKDITLIIIETVKIEEYEKLEKLFHERQLILDDMNNINYSNKELQTIYLKNGIEDLEKILASEMEIRKSDLLRKIKTSQNRKIGMTGYNNMSAKAVFLSKEI